MCVVFCFCFPFLPLCRLEKSMTGYGRLKRVGGVGDYNVRYLLLTYRVYCNKIFIDIVFPTPKSRVIPSSTLLSFPFTSVILIFLFVCFFGVFFVFLLLFFFFFLGGGVIFFFFFFLGGRLFFCLFFCFGLFCFSFFFPLYLSTLNFRPTFLTFRSVLKNIC